MPAFVAYIKKKREKERKEIIFSFFFFFFFFIGVIIMDDKEVMDLGYITFLRVQLAVYQTIFIIYV